MFRFKFKKTLSDGRMKMVNHLFNVSWFKNNKFHRDNRLPAIIFYFGRKLYWENGIPLEYV